MALLRGVDVLLYVPSDATEPVAGQKNATLSLSRLKLLQCLKLKPFLVFLMSRNASSICIRFL